MINIKPEFYLQELAHNIDTADVVSLSFMGANFGRPFCAPIKITDRDIIEDTITSLRTARNPFISNEEPLISNKEPQWIATTINTTDFLFIHFEQRTEPLFVRFDASKHSISTEFEAVLALVGNYQAQQVRQRVRHHFVNVKTIRFMHHTVTDANEMHEIRNGLEKIDGRVFAFAHPASKRLIVEVATETDSEIFCLFVPFTGTEDSWKELLPSALWSYFISDAI